MFGIICLLSNMPRLTWIWLFQLLFFHAFPCTSTQILRGWWRKHPWFPHENDPISPQWDFVLFGLKEGASCPRVLASTHRGAAMPTSWGGAAVGKETAGEEQVNPRGRSKDQPRGSILNWWMCSETSTSFLLTRHARASPCFQHHVHRLWQWFSQLLTQNYF